MSFDTLVQSFILNTPDVDTLHALAQKLEFLSPQTGQLMLRWSFLYLTSCTVLDARIAEIAHLALCHGASVEDLRDHIIAYNMVQMLPTCSWSTSQKDLLALPVFHFIQEKAMATCLQQIVNDGHVVPPGEAGEKFLEDYMSSFAHLERYYFTTGQIVYQSLMAVKNDEPPADLTQKRLLNSIEQGMQHPGKTYLKSIPYTLSSELKEALKAL